MPLLALDTSAAVAVAVLSDEGAPIVRRSIDERRKHAEALTPLIAEALMAAGATPRDLTAVAVGTGPAPFTGLRVGLVTARTIAAALGVPVWGVPSLDAVAMHAAGLMRLAPGDEILAVADARRKEVYWARYRVSDIVAEQVSIDDGGQYSADLRARHGVTDNRDIAFRFTNVPLLRCIDGPGVAKPADVAAEQAGRTSTGRTVVVGEGARMYADHFTPIAPDAAVTPLLPDAAIIGWLAAARAAAGNDVSTDPLYLRRPDVHEPAAAAAAPVTAAPPQTAR
ncbi:MAG: tRNA (adenosine(37)-N6)-threonylcarbamoyltransferase complex dimerization subunit type 1 TsaB [Cellulomonadaceae bacterium]|nr:tRNA (adenosine(37)-N6)-threonylcarbamoyltransferase complex dimerization subunit type 1 TsaB [Cellulomonadaceae bacterium]